MTDFTDYIDCVRGRRFYDGYDLAQLQLAYNRALAHFSVDDNDPRRETFGVMIFQASDETRDADRLLSIVVNLYCRLN